MLNSIKTSVCVVFTVLNRTHKRSWSWRIPVTFPCSHILHITSICFLYLSLENVLARCFYTSALWDTCTVNNYHKTDLNSSRTGLKQPDGLNVCWLKCLWIEMAGLSDAVLHFVNLYDANIYTSEIKCCVITSQLLTNFSVLLKPASHSKSF